MLRCVWFLKQLLQLHSYEKITFALFFLFFDWSCRAVCFVCRTTWTSLMICLHLIPPCSNCRAANFAVRQVTRRLLAVLCRGPLLGAQRKSSLLFVIRHWSVFVMYRKAWAKFLMSTESPWMWDAPETHSLTSPMSSFLSLPSSLENRMIL